jgi:hypothetical protein
MRDFPSNERGGNISRRTHPVHYWIIFSLQPKNFLSVIK